MGKGEDTKAAIVDQALNLVSTVGLEKLTIGALASATGMSKSGLFAHFDSKEQLQLQVLEEARQALRRHGHRASPEEASRGGTHSGLVREHDAEVGNRIPRGLRV